MIGPIVSFVMGLAVGVAYGLLHIRSPAPPLIALVGLLGMVLGEQMATAAWSHFAPPVQSAAELLRDHAERLAEPDAGRRP